ncbi:MAG: 7TM diverse intracellular signaling domain-containing protein, partial [Panacibacter sp.]
MNSKYIFIVWFTLLFSNAKADPVFNFTSFDNSMHLGSYLEFYVDSTGKMLPSQILEKTPFKTNNKITPLFPISNNAVWIKFSIANKTNDPEIFLLIQHANISKIELYKDSADTMLSLGVAGNSLTFSYQIFSNPNYVFDLQLKPGNAQDYYLRITSFHPVLLPIVIGELSDIENTLHTQTSIINLYLGIILAIFLYNFFLFISTFDRTYFYYILFIGLLGLAQLTVSGYSFFYLWSNFPAINRIAVPVTTCLAGIGTGLFTISFLKTKTYTPVIHVIFIVIIIIYIVSAFFSISGYNKISYAVFNYTNLAAAIVSIIVSFYIAKKGYKPAYFYFISFIAFSICLVIRELRNINILPDNNFTSYILYIGSAIQAILLSFALADKINSLRIEKEASQTYALKISQENEKLIREQNIVLEQKVAERTDELQNTNSQLNRTLGDLKDAQMQLVEAEKMASLGQLTAGIAHEINNPINFVKSNIRPLQLDIDDLFEIIDQYNLLHNTGKDKIEQHLQTVY